MFNSSLRSLPAPSRDFNASVRRLVRLKAQHNHDAIRRARAAAVVERLCPPQLCPPRRARHRRQSGGDRTRTDDILLAKQALSQLSYAPKNRREGGGPGLT